MPPENTSVQNVYKKPSMGSFPVNTLLGDLNNIVTERRRKINSPEATLKTVEADTSGILEAGKAIEEIISRHAEQVSEQQTPTPPIVTTIRNFDGIKSSSVIKLEKKLQETLEALDNEQREVQRLTALKNSQDNSVSVYQEKIEQPEIIHIPQSETSTASIKNLLPNFSERQSTQTEILGAKSDEEIIIETPVQVETPQFLPVITSEMLHETPSGLSQIRSGKLMAKIPTPRPRLVNGKTHEERMVTLLKKETPPDDFIDKSLETVAEVAKKIQELEYPRASELTEKLATDSKKIITRTFANMFSDKPTPVEQQTKQ